MEVNNDASGEPNEDMEMGVKNMSRCWIKAHKLMDVDGLMLLDRFLKPWFWVLTNERISFMPC